MNQNERYFRKTVGAIGGSLLLFLGLLEGYSVLLGVVIDVLSFMPFPVTVLNTIYELISGAGYLFCFMMPVLLLKLLVKKSGYPYQPMQTSLRVSPLWLLTIPAGIMLVFSAAQINVFMTDIFNPPSFMDQFMGGDYESVPTYLWVLQFITVCVVPGFCEEFFFRGAILTNCLPFGRSNAILISALIFSLMHQNPSQIFYAFAAGIVLGVLYERTHSICPGTVLHLLNNFASVGESMIMNKYTDGLRATLGLMLFETALFIVGGIALIILVRRCFSKAENYADGVFGSNASSLAVEAACPVAPKPAFKLFLHPTMLIFLILCTVKIAALLFFNGVI